VCEGTPPGFSFLLLFFPFFVRALILSPLSRVMGDVYVFSRIKACVRFLTDKGYILGCLLVLFFRLQACNPPSEPEVMEG